MADNVVTQAVTPDHPDDHVHYQVRHIKGPALTGIPLKMMVSIAETPLFNPIRSFIMHQNQIPSLLRELHLPELPLWRPDTSGWVLDDKLDAEEIAVADEDPVEVVERAAELIWKRREAHRPSHLPSIIDYHEAYTTGKASPSQVIENIIKAIELSEAQDPPMRFLISHKPGELRAAAMNSDMRFRMGTQVGILDGVPFAVKDMVDVEGHPTTCGTAFMGNSRKVEGTLPGVQALLDAGAILIGKANSHEIGLGTTGLNTVTGTPRNPHNPSRHTGGSSSGSAAIVGAGVVPFAIGTDGGGSIRIPASLCGVVGLKPTDNRISTKHSPSIDHTVAVAGPIAASVSDIALVFSVMANRGHDVGINAHVLSPPPPVKLPELADLLAEEQPLKGRKIGVYWPWFEDGEPAVVEQCRKAVDFLQEKGAEIVSISIPDLELLAPAHTCTIVSEMRSSLSGALSDANIRSTMNAETRISLAIGGGFTGADYIQSQKIRRRMDGRFRRVFEAVDWLVTPTTPITAPLIRPKALESGETDVTTTTSLMRYMQAANLVGFPAITVPVGRVDGLPVGLQLMGPPWHEAGLLLAGAVLESMPEAFTKATAKRWDVLSPSFGFEEDRISDDSDSGV